jgi:heat shock protein HslJ
MNTASTATLENTYWKLAEMNGKPIVTPADAKEVHIILTNEGENKRVKGHAGCNSLGGSYTLSGNEIKFITITTKMMCVDRMDVEDFLLNALSVANRYKITGETLELFQGDTLVARFQSVYLK